MTSPHVSSTTLFLALGCGLFAAHAQAQSPSTVAATLPTVTVRPGVTTDPVSVTGFGDETPDRTPISATVISAQAVADAQARRVSDLIQLDASASDAYNAIGYWDYVSIRGFVLDNGYNHRRDGLPISAETALPLENRESIELLKGTTGIQAGTSAPGGLLNHVIKRPTAIPLRKIRTELNQAGNLLTHVDLGGRFGEDKEFGYRLNLAAERMRTPTPGTRGDRELAALALDWRLRPGSLLEVEMERSRRSQPGVPGLSLTGNALPAPNPFTNINTQPWSQPGLMQGLTGSVRYTQSLNADWSWTAQASSQNLKANDFLAYPYGCFDGGSGTYYADRYCPNGDFDLYDYRSLNERRTTQAAEWRIKGQTQLGSTRHHLQAGVMHSRYTERGQPQADNNASVGTGNIYTLPALPPDATFADPYTLRNERSTEWFAYDRIEWNRQLSTWVGLRHSRIDRDSIRTDGSRATAYQQGFNAPWLALAWQWAPTTMVYASTGQGVESVVAPGRSRYTNANQALDPLKSRQWEMGFKQSMDNGQWGAALFSITRPSYGDAGTCDVANSCTLRRDGDVRHQGLELTASQSWGPWNLSGSAMWLNAVRRNGTIDPTLNGKTPTNVPDFVLRVNASVAIASVPGLSVQAGLSHEGGRSVVPDGSVQLPAWTRVDAGLVYRVNTGPGQTKTWRLGIKNLANRRYFQESPYQYSHVYLFPAAPRSVSVGYEADF